MVGTLSDACKIFNKYLIKEKKRKKGRERGRKGPRKGGRERRKKMDLNLKKKNTN